MMKALALMMAVLATGPLAAQQTPFDMSGERSPDARGALPLTFEDSAPPVAQESVGAITGTTPDEFRRYLIPYPSLSLTGEADERAWSIYLTPAQAAAGSRLTFAYQNAIVVAPEASVLSVFVNGKLVGEGPVQAAEERRHRSYAIPADLLRTGSNEIRFRVRQRHRTDCTIQSTYELWTEIASETAFISFEAGGAGALTTIEDIEAIGHDGAGRTHFNVVVPALEQPSRAAPLMRLAQGLALLGHMPTQTIAFRQDMPELGEAGELTVLAGTVSELAPLLGSLPTEATTGPLASFLRTDRDQTPVLVVTGPDWTAVEKSIDVIAKATDRPAGVARDVIDTERWRLPETPLVASGKRLAFSELGIDTREFSGRRLKTAFTVAVPADFYADAYGEARIFLDAAYTDAVRPGSRIDVYVNGSIASTVPLGSSRGTILDHLPISVTLRHFHPGANLIEMEAVLLTEADTVCAPGSPASSDARFALFDTSEFEMPDFARIARRPDLAATAGTAYPYIGNARPVAFYLDRADADTLSTAGTLLARLAVAGGRPLPVDMITSPLAAGDREAVFIGAMPQLPRPVLTQAGIETGSQVSWGRASDLASGGHTKVALQQWQTRLKGGGTWQSTILGFEEWIKERFDISLSSLRLIPRAEPAFAPPDSATLLLAQAANPSGDATWTVVTAPSPKLLREGVSAIVDVSRWGGIAGHVAIYEPATDKVTAIPATHLDFVETRAPSLWNYRLIAANWLSTNILFYAMLLASLAVLLGLATAGLLAKLGRRP